MPRTKVVFYQEDDGIVKERRVPPREIEVAIRRKTKFPQDPTRHTYEER